MKNNDNKKRNKYKPREFTYVGDPIPKITYENYPEFLLLYQKAILQSLVKRDLLTNSQMERVIEKLEIEHIAECKKHKKPPIH